MTEKPIQKLNKRLILWALIVLCVVGIPLIIVPLASSPKKDPHGSMAYNKPSLGNTNADDAFAISGTERFPANYGSLKKFQTEMDNEKLIPQEDEFFKALEGLENNTANNATAKNEVITPVFANKEDPWAEAAYQEQRQRAFDYYVSRRSDIKFIDKATPNKGELRNQEEDPMIRMMERTLSMAAGRNTSENQHDVFFLKNNPGDSDIGKLKDPQPFMVSQGTLIPAILISEIDTSLPGPILARVSHNIWDSKTGQTLLVPQNSKLIGEYSSSIGHGQERAQVVWQRIIFPNQQSINLGSMVGVDKRGSSGAAGTVDNHYDKVALGLLLTTALNAGVRMTQGKYDANSASIGQEIGNSLAQETARMGNKIIDKTLAIPPTIKIPIGKRINVFVEQDLSLQPYNKG